MGQADHLICLPFFFALYLDTDCQIKIFEYSGFISVKKELFLHEHPYEIFIPGGCEKIIIGTLPPPRLSTGELRERDVDFCYGSCDNLLWPILEKVFDRSFQYNNSREAVDERKNFLRENKMGICDMVASCRRAKINASDLGMSDIVLRDIFHQLDLCPTLHTFLFMGGNTKNGPEYFFRRQAREQQVQLQRRNDTSPRRHVFEYKGRPITTVSLISPSNAANRAIGSTDLYKERKARDPHYSTFDYRVEQYRNILLDG